MKACIHNYTHFLILLPHVGISSYEALYSPTSQQSAHNQTKLHYNEIHLLQNCTKPNERQNSLLGIMTRKVNESIRIVSLSISLVKRKLYLVPKENSLPLQFLVFSARVLSVKVSFFEKEKRMPTCANGWFLVAWQNSLLKR